MSIDLSQFHQVFFEESFEGLDIMEAGLLELDPTALDDETINSIFRAAHSIKGGSATFGFSSVAEFTHVLETLLDEVRAGIRSIGQSEVDLFLQSVDCLRDLLGGLQAESEVDTAQAESLRLQFEKILGQESDPEAAEPSDGEATATASSGGWKIFFKPESHILLTGNEPLRMFWQLAEMGELSIETDTSDLTSFSTMNVEACYFSWKLELRGNIKKEAVEEIFEWVVDDSELIIEPLGSIESEVEVEAAVEVEVASIVEDVKAPAAPAAKKPAKSS